MTTTSTRKYSLQAGADATEVVPEGSGFSHDSSTLVTVAHRTAFHLKNETAGSNKAINTAPKKTQQRNKRG